jgi:hypothetical protein
MDDRRDSPRIPAKFRIRTEGSLAFEDATGDLNVNGVRWDAPRPIHEGSVDVLLQVPGLGDDFMAHGQVLGPREGPAHAYGIQFTDVSAAGELGIARYLHEVAVGWE